jgi:H/ACA ribonucleoprotein complex subunit 2
MDPLPSLPSSPPNAHFLPAAKNKSLKRGVKEVVKALRKSAPATTTQGPSAPPAPAGVVVLAADISPMDVISHIPVLCEDHGIPYIFVPSRAELGAAGATKRPTSVVMVGLDRVGKKEAIGEGGAEAEAEAKAKAKAEAEAEFREVYGELVKVVVKAGRDVRV